MDGLHAITWNVNGLNSPIKRTRCLEYLHSKKVKLAIIQETHLKSCDVHRFQNRRYKILSSSCAPNKTRGVLILAARSLQITVHHTYSDGHGRFTLVIITIGQARLLIASVYAPNSFDPDFLHTIYDKLLGMPEYSLIIGGDFNCAMYDIDRTTSSTDPRASSALQKFVTDLQLIDVWRFHNRSTRNYTFFFFQTGTNLFPYWLHIFKPISSSSSKTRYLAHSAVRSRSSIVPDFPKRCPYKGHQMAL